MSMSGGALGADPIFMVQMNIAAEAAERMNKWYDEVHVPEVMSVHPGLVSATRMRRVTGDAEHEYIAIYRFCSEDALSEFLKAKVLAQMGEDYVREWGAVSTRVRGAYVPMLHRDSNVASGKQS